MWESGQGNNFLTQMDNLINEGKSEKSADIGDAKAKGNIQMKGLDYMQAILEAHGKMTKAN